MLPDIFINFLKKFVLFQFLNILTYLCILTLFEDNYLTVTFENKVKNLEKKKTQKYLF